MMCKFQFITKLKAMEIHNYFHFPFYTLVLLRLKNWIHYFRKLYENVVSIDRIVKLLYMISRDAKIDSGIVCDWSEGHAWLETQALNFFRMCSDKIIDGLKW